MKFTLSARPPFNFLSVINSHGWRQLAPFSYAEGTHTLSYVLRLSNGRVIELHFRAYAGFGVELSADVLLARAQRFDLGEGLSVLVPAPEES